MARINVEETILKDKRFEKLILKLGSREAALGVCVEAWFLGQHYWKKGQRPIPKAEWKKQCLNEALIEVGLVREQEGGYYVCGAKKHFEWIYQRVEAAKAGGRKNAGKRRRKSEDMPHCQTESKTEQTESKLKPHPHTHPHTQTDFQLQTQIQEGACAPLPSSDGRANPLFILWNAHRGKLPEARSCMGARSKKAQIRWKEQTPEQWEATIERMAASNFCQGKNSSGWRADFDFLLKPDTWAKVNEGKYDNNRGAITTNKTKTYDKLDELRNKYGGPDEVPDGEVRQ